MARSKEYIFKENERGELKFVGDFEAFYQAEEDPWQQSAQYSDISSYYHFSRKNISEYMISNQYNHCLEIGCGVGHSTEQLAQLSKLTFSGADISETAIRKATMNYPNISFHQLDISVPLSNHELDMLGKFDCIILNQVLWYIMHALPQVKDNLIKLLLPGGTILFATAFLNEQRYGRDVFIGYSGFISYLQKKWQLDFNINYQKYDDSGEHGYYDGLVCLNLLDNHQP